MGMNMAYPHTEHLITLIFEMKSIAILLLTVPVQNRKIYFIFMGAMINLALWVDLGLDSMFSMHHIEWDLGHFQMRYKQFILGSTSGVVLKVVIHKWL